MSFEVGVTVTFEAHHHLVGNFGPATQPHGHTYRVEATVSGQQLLPDGTLFDITRLQSALDGLIAQLDSRDLNQIEGLAAPNPTVEVVARYLAERLAPALDGQSLDQLTTRVWESPEAFASYSRSLT
jgi:6-pyruvoyltetrahydropterin/6-carboxytetrahydropterin synthase